MQIQGWNTDMAVRLSNALAVSLFERGGRFIVCALLLFDLARWLSFNLLSAVAVASELLPLFGPVFLITLCDQVGGGWSGRLMLRFVETSKVCSAKLA